MSVEFRTHSKNPGTGNVFRSQEAYPVDCGFRCEGKRTLSRFFSIRLEDDARAQLQYAGIGGPGYGTETVFVVNCAVRI